MKSPARRALSEDSLFGRRSKSCAGRVAAVFSLFASFALLTAAAGAGTASAACPNVVFRSGPSAKLPDCRAYELVTPRYTAGIPMGMGSFGFPPNEFSTSPVSSDGESVIYTTVGGGFPGLPANGNVDRYRSYRTSEGWVTQAFGASGSQVQSALFGGAVEGRYSMETDFNLATPSDLWEPFSGKSFASLLRTPTGTEPLARGSLGDDTGGQAGLSDRGEGLFISPDGQHIIFSDNQKLEPNAPESGIGEIIYDRKPGGPTHVVSLLPGDVTPDTNMAFIQATPDGSEVAFTPEHRYSIFRGMNTLYVRRDNVETVEVIRASGLVVGRKLSCSGATFPAGATFEYQWLRNAVPIPGAGSSEYTVTAADEGTVIQCRVTAVNGEGKSFAASSTRVVEPYIGKTLPEGEASGFISPSGDGTRVAFGQLLTCNNNTLKGNPTVDFQWMRDGVDIPGATEKTYMPVESDIGSSFQCRITSTTAEGKAVAYTNNVLTIVAPYPRATANPLVTNTTDPGNAPAAGDELSCSAGTWVSSPTFSYQWLRNGAAIGGATSAGYTVTASDEGKALQCAVTGANSYATTQAASLRLVVDPQPATKPPIQTFPGNVFGTPQVGQTLFCATGEWAGRYSYEPEYDPAFALSTQWLRNGAAIGGATSSEYTLTAADKETVVQCRVTATNSTGVTVAINADEGAKYVMTPGPPRFPSASVPGLGYMFNGLYNGHVFYSDKWTDLLNLPTGSSSLPGDLYTKDLDTGVTTQITNTGDATFINVSEDGSHAFFTSLSQYNGEGEAGKPNLYVWSRSGDSIKFIATLRNFDLYSRGSNGQPGLTQWAHWFWANKDRATDHSRSTPDGEHLAFESTAQLTSFDNVEAEPEDCAERAFGGELCSEVYLYDVATDELTCVSCPPGDGPANGEGRIQSIGEFGSTEAATLNTAVESLTDDGEELFFETKESLVRRDLNEALDVYRWKRGAPVALISTAQNRAPSSMFGVSSDGSNVVFATRQQLLPEDENGSTTRFYDARVNGGYPPPEATVTEPCTNDVCQGQPSATPEEPQISSSSINGKGNFSGKLKCGKRLRRVVRHGTEVCVPRKRRHKHRGHRGEAGKGHSGHKGGNR